MVADRTHKGPVDGGGRRAEADPSLVDDLGAEYALTLGEREAHASRVADLTAEEAAELGSLLRTATSVVTELLLPELFLPELLLPELLLWAQARRFWRRLPLEAAWTAA